MATVFVNPPPLIPGASAPTYQLTNNYGSIPTFDLVTQPASLATCTDNTCYNYQWQKSTNGTTWTDIAGATSRAYNPGLYQPTVTTYYRTKVTANGQTAYSNNDTISAQTSVINGVVDCWLGQTTSYSYLVGNPSQYSWSVSAGSATIIGTSSGVASYTLKWILAGIFTVTLNNNGTFSTVQVYVHQLPLSPGVIGKPVSTIENTSAITVQPWPYTGAIGGNCTGSFTYQWEQSTDGTNYAAISGQTNLTLTITPTQNSYYRRKVVCGATTAYTDTTRIYLFPYFNPGTISYGVIDSISWNSAPSLITGSLPTGGMDSVFRFQWEYSTDATNYFSISNNAEVLNYQSDALTVSTWIRRRVTNGSTTRYTNAVLVKVKQVLFDPGIISPYTLVINNGTTPSALSGTTANGGTVATYTYQWQQSVDEVNWVSIAGATSSNYSPPILNRTTYYRRMVTNNLEKSFSVVAGFLNVIKVKVLPPVTASLIVPDPAIPVVTAQPYVLPSITNAMINYVRAWDIKKPAITTVAAAKALTSVDDYNQVTNYFDDLGQPLQSVAKKASALQMDLVSGLVNCDVLGRTVQQFLPYADAGGTGDFKASPSAQLITFNNTQFNNQEGFYYNNSVYEKSPLNRVIKQTAPGNSFTGNNIGVRTDYGFNVATDSVRNWTIGTSISDAPASTGYYTPGSLVLIVTTDEHENKVMEYKDKESKTILKKVQLSDTLYNGYQGWLSTYYIYDVFGSLRYVLSPNAVQYAVANNWSLSATVLTELCFRYYYDATGKMILKKVPGAGETWMVYDARDRVVLTQDSNLRVQQKWTYTTYDELNRTVSTGLITDNTNYNNLNFHISAAATSTAYPNLGSYAFEELSRTFYDNYSFSGVRAYDGTYAGFLSAGTNPWPETIAQSNHSFGVPTGAKIKVLGSTSTWIVTTTYYDEKGRVIQTLTDNANAGVDVMTNQYDFSGKPLSNYLHHRNPSSALTPEVKVLTKMLYDHGGRVKKVWKQLNNSGVDKLVSENDYNELGQLRTKKIGTKSGTALPIETQDFEYTIRGWLKSINKNYANNTSNTNFYGQIMGYENGLSRSQFNGNISSLQWRSKGDGELRAYGFIYDNVNRLLKADFTQYTGTVWNTGAGIDFSMKMGDGVNPYTAYDANGNIKGMTQKGWKLGGSVVIDSLVYKYTATTNKLKWVRDISNDVNSKLGDFKEPVQNNSDNLGSDLADYSYDGNGSMTADNNKSISSISYNHLNLPATVTVTGKGTIVYTYDAGGNKLKKVTTEGTKISTTTYLSGFVYQRVSTTGSTADTLQFFGQEEGRIRYTAPVGAAVAKYSFDYLLKDHLGNIRAVLTEETQQDIYPAATLEGNLNTSTDAAFIEKNYYTIDPAYVVAKTAASGITDYINKNGGPGITDPPVNNNPNGSSTANSAKLYQLNSTTNKTGLSISLKVMAGDTLSIYGKSYYLVTGSIPGSSSSVPMLDLLNAFAGTGGLAGKGISGGSLNAITQVTTGIVGLLGTQPAQTSVQAKAFINWVFFDERFNYAGGGFDQVGSSGTVKSHSNLAIVAPKSGYIFVYCSNESQLNVFFDNLQVVHNRGPLLEETHYYPFGLTMSGISSKALSFGGAENRYKYNGIEFENDLDLNTYEAFYRELDPQTGKWWEIDPKIEKNMETWSPYSSNFDNPIKFNDPKGDCPLCKDLWDAAKETGIALKDAVVEGYTAVTNVSRVINQANPLASLVEVITGKSSKSDFAQDKPRTTAVADLGVNTLLVFGGPAVRAVSAVNKIETITVRASAGAAAAESSAAKGGLTLESSVSKVLGNSYKAIGEVTVPIKNTELLNSLNATSKGNWVKVYEAGLQNGVKTETHFFRNNTTNQVFDVKTKYNYWHQKAFKSLGQ